MKKLSCIFILLAIACIFTSCKLTGDFAIVKRQHAGGYYIQTPSFKRNVRLRSPSFVRINSASRSLAYESPTSLPRGKAGRRGLASPQCDYDYKEWGNADFQPAETSDNLIASVNAVPLAETTPQAKTIAPAKAYFPPFYVNKPIARDTTKKTASNSSHYNKDNGKKMDWHSLAAFISSCAAILFMPLMFYSSVVAITLAGLSEFLALFGIIFGFIGEHKIKKNSDKLKGKVFADVAVIMGFLYYVLFLIVIIIAIELWKKNMI